MKTISDYLSLDSQMVENTGAFNAILGVDSRLFVDPPLAYKSTIPEFLNAKEKVHKYFKTVMMLVRKSTKKYDKCWNSAVKQVTVPEIKGISIGYSATKGNGNGIGKELAKQIIDDAHQISEVARENVYFFELLGLFEKNIGSDRISDLIIHILKDEFIAYTKRIFKELNRDYKSDAMLPSGDSMILVPKSFLSNLPHAEFTFRHDITDEKVRDFLNADIGNSWKDAFTKEDNSYDKHDVFKVFINEPKVFKAFINDYLKTQIYSYNFVKDPDGEVIWYEETKKAVEKTKYEFLPIAEQLNNSQKNILEKALIMCEIFKTLVEDNKLGNLFYKESYAEPKREDAIQLVFYGVCHFFSLIHNLDLTPESNTGRGPVDFKISKGVDKVLIEVKKTLYTNLAHGYFVQLEEYKKSEKTNLAIFLVVNLEGETSEKNFKKFKDIIVNTPILERKSKVVYVDARKKESASKF